MKKNNKGFTLVELIVVIAILGVLMAVLVPQYIQYVEKSRESTDISTLGEILHAVEIDAATKDTAPTPVELTITAGSVAIPTAYQSVLGASVQLKSTDGKELSGTTAITFNTNGKAGWGTACADTATAFSYLADGSKTSGTSAVPAYTA